MYWQDTWRHKNDIGMIKSKRLYNFDIIVRDREGGPEMEFGRSLS